MVKEQYKTRTPDEKTVSKLYHQLLEAWNDRDADAYADLFATDATVVGFDGSQMEGAKEILTELRLIFSDHVTARYVAVLKEIKDLAKGVIMLRAVAGMVPRGQSEIKSEQNAIQTLVVIKEEEQWKIELFQNTPAQFHGRPYLADELNEELNKALQEKLEHQH